MILDLSTWFLVWLLAHTESIRRVTLAAPLLQACSSCSSLAHVNQACVSQLLFTLALHLLLSSLALNLPRARLNCTSQHSDTPMCRSVVCVRCPPTHSSCLRWQIIVDSRTTKSEKHKCGVRLLQPFLLAYALLCVGALVPVCGFFLLIEHLFPCFPRTHSVVLSGKFSTRASYGAQLCEACDPLIDCVWHVNFWWLSTKNST